MEAAEQIHLETPKSYSKIDFIEEIIFNNEKDSYKMQLGIKENDLLIKVDSNKSKDIYYYQQSYTINELQNISIVFTMYKTAKEIIAFLKDLKYEIEEKNENLTIRFNIFMPNGKNKLIEMDLKKCLPDTNSIINYCLEKIKSMELNMKNLEENYKSEKAKNESEIKDLKEKLKMEKEKHELEIKDLKENISKNKREIQKLNDNILINQSEINNLKENNKDYKNENNQLWEEINKLKQYHIISNQKLNGKYDFDSKIIESKDNINFILDYIKQNDKTFNFNNIKLLFRGSRDGERIKTCHELCDNKQNVLIIMKSDYGNIFGGYSKVGFKVNNSPDYKIDNNCFLFSLNLKKIYPVINDKQVICHIGVNFGLCFYNSLSFYDYFMSKKSYNIKTNIKKYFNGLENIYEMNGGQNDFKFQELEVFQLL